MSLKMFPALSKSPKSDPDVLTAHVRQLIKLSKTKPAIKARSRVKSRRGKPR